MKHILVSIKLVTVSCNLLLNEERQQEFEIIIKTFNVRKT
jgi:hypothetical protein